MGESDERKPGLGGRRHRRASSLPSLEIWSSPPIVLEPRRKQNCERKGARTIATDGEERARAEEVKPSLSPSRVESPPRLVSVAAELQPPPFLPPSSLSCRRSVWFCFELRSRVRGRRGQCCGCQEYQGFRIGSDGNLQRVGLFINIEPRTGHLVSDLQRTTLKICADCSEVNCYAIETYPRLRKTWFRLSILETHFSLLHRTFSSAASPAARAGIHQGDELVEINGERLDGLDSEAAAQRLRGNAGTTVTVKSTDQKALKKILVAAHDKSQKKVDKAIEDIQKDEGRDTK
ncbi:hypothetical protein AHAS_Ahas15G0364300 [Arachis hypogaea]